MATISSWRDVPLWLWMALLLGVVLVFSYARSSAGKGNRTDDETTEDDAGDTPNASTAFPLFVAGGADSITGSAVPPTMAGRTTGTSPYYQPNTAQAADIRGTSSPTSVTSTGQDY